MLSEVDFHQVRTLTRFALMAEWRQSSSRSFRRKQKRSHAWAIWTVIAYIGTGLLLARLFKGNLSGQSYITAASIDMLVLGFVTASNIFLSFGTGFLSPDEAQMIAPMPVSSDTFFLSRLTVLLAYTWVITLLFIVGPAVFLPLKWGTSITSSLVLVGSALLSNTAAAMAIVVIYGLVLRKLPKQTLSRTLGYVQFAGSFVTAFAFMFLRIERSIDFNHITLESIPPLALIPSFWFGSLAGLTSAPATGLHITLAIIAILFVAVLAYASHVLLGTHYMTEVGELTLSSATMTKRSKQRKDSAIFRLALRFARSYEARAVFMLMRAQFRFDQKFRLSVLSTLPITILYLIVAILSPQGIRDPFVGNWRSVLQAQFLYIFAMLMPLLVMQSVSQSENYKAAWIFFAAPLDRAKVLLAVRNTLLVSIVLPYMTVLAVVLSFFMPPIHAISHVLVLAAIAGFIFQAYLMFTPKMPFAQKRRPSRTSFAAVIGVGSFAFGAMLLLGLEIYYGYQSQIRFWLTFALLVTLSLLLEQVVRKRIRHKLDREEFES